MCDVMYLYVCKYIYLDVFSKYALHTGNEILVKCVIYLYAACNILLCEYPYVNRVIKMLLIGT